MNLNLLYYYFRVLRAAAKPSRFVNALKLAVSYQLSRLGIVTSWKVLPQFISIEPTNICNLHCPECPVGMRTQQVKAIPVEMKTVAKVLDELKSVAMHAILYFQGEPLRNKNFVEMVRLARAQKLLTSTSTNAQLLTDETAKAIVQSDLDRIIISIDGTTQETYETYRVGGKLEKTTQAIERLVKWKKELKSRTPLIEMQFLVLKTNEHQMDEVKSLKKKLKADRLVFKSAQLYDFESGHPLLPKNKRFARYELRADGKYHIKSPQRNSCKRLWMGAVINSKGDSLPCCFDKDSSYSFGNITNENFADTWHSEKAYSFRKAILVDRKQFEMCRNCSER